MAIENSVRESMAPESFRSEGVEWERRGARKESSRRAIPRAKTVSFLTKRRVGVVVCDGGGEGGGEKLRDT